MQTEPNNTADPEQAAALPLCVDLDGTLTKSDMFWECAARSLARPAALIAGILALPKGRARVKAELSKRIAPTLAVDLLPYDQAVWDYVARRRTNGAPVELVSGADQALVDRVAAHTGLFDAAIGSDGIRNLTGNNKAAALAERHPGGYAYIGNSSADLAPWAGAQEVLVANASARLRQVLQDQATPFHEISRRVPFGNRWRALTGARYWLFAVLVTLPALLGQGALATAVAALPALALMASGGAILGTLARLDTLRADPVTRDGPLVSTQLSIPKAIVLAGGQLAVGAGLAAVVPAPHLLGGGLVVAIVAALLAGTARAARVQTGILAVALSVLILGIGSGL